MRRLPEFTPDHRPAPGISRYLYGTLPVAMARWSRGIDTVLAAAPLGGLERCARSRWR